MTTIDYRPEDPATLADPFPLLARLRDEDPCHWSPRLKSWVLTRYDDVKRVCLGAGMSSNRLQPFFAAMPSAEAGRIADIVRYLSLWMVFKDPPEHTRLRRLTSKVFHVQSMQGMRPQVEAIAQWLLDGIGERFDETAEFDFIAEYAGPLGLSAVVVRAWGCVCSGARGCGCSGAGGRGPWFALAPARGTESQGLGTNQASPKSAPPIGVDSLRVGLRGTSTRRAGGRLQGSVEWHPWNRTSWS